MDILQQTQLDIEAVLNSLDLYRHVPVTVIRPRDEGEAIEIQTKIDQALGGLEMQDGKAGLAVMVMMCEAGVPLKKVTGYLKITVRLRVLERTMVNMGADGTQIACESLALSTLSALHGRSLGAGRILEPLESAAVTPVDLPGVLAYDVVMTCHHQEPGVARVDEPRVRREGADYVLTAGAGSAIWYTLDGSYPVPDGATATLYSEPISTSGVAVRAVAYAATGAHPSNCLEFRIP